MKADDSKKAEPATDDLPFPKEEYLAAVAEEREARDYAFLGFNHFVCGVEIVPITLRQLLIRFAINCPFLSGERTPFPSEIASFLWFLSSDFAPSGSKKSDRMRASFIKRLEKIPYNDALEDIGRYLDLMFMDSPPACRTSKVPRTSIAATFIDIFGAAYGWPAEKTLDSPVAQLYQLITELQFRNNPKAIFFNRKSDRVRGNWLKKLQAVRAAKQT